MLFEVLLSVKSLLLILLDQNLVKEIPNRMKVSKALHWEER